MSSNLFVEKLEHLKLILSKGLGGCAINVTPGAAPCVLQIPEIKVSKNREFIMTAEVFVCDSRIDSLEIYGRAQLVVNLLYKHYKIEKINFFLNADNESMIANIKIEERIK